MTDRFSPREVRDAKDALLGALQAWLTAHPEDVPEFLQALLRGTMGAMATLRQEAADARNAVTDALILTEKKRLPQAIVHSSTQRILKVLGDGAGACEIDKNFIKQHRGDADARSAE